MYEFFIYRINNIFPPKKNNQQIRMEILDPD